MTVCFKNPNLGNIPDYWNIPLTSYNSEVCFVTSDSVVAAPKLLIRTIFPEFNNWLCDGCVSSHERVTVIVKDLHSDQLEEAFRELASGNVDMLADLIELSPYSATNQVTSDEKDRGCETSEEINVKQEPQDNEVDEQEVTTCNSKDNDETSSKKRLIFCD